jgi:hypothetical protein
MTPVAVYVGAGLDLRPIIAIHNCKNFLYIDVCKSDKFIDDFNKKIDLFGFDLIATNISPENIGCFIWTSKQKKINQFIKKIYFRKKDKCEVIYYFGIEYPNIQKELSDQINECNILIISGFDPCGDIIDQIKKPFDVICFETKNYYRYCSLESNGVLKRLYKIPPNYSKILLYKKQYIEYDCTNMIDLRDILEKNI